MVGHSGYVKDYSKVPLTSGAALATPVSDDDSRDFLDDPAGCLVLQTRPLSQGPA